MPEKARPIEKIRRGYEIVVHSKDKLGTQLNVSGLADVSSPGTKARAGDIFHKSPSGAPRTSVDKPVPVPGIEKFTPELEGDPLRNPRVLDECEVVTVIGEPSYIANPGALTGIEVEAIGGFESTSIEQRFVGVKAAALFLGKRVGPRKNRGNATSLELIRNIAQARAEDVRNARRACENRGHLPASDDRISHP